MAERCCHRSCSRLAAAYPLRYQPSSISLVSRPSQHCGTFMRESLPEARKLCQQLRALAVSPAAAEKVTTAAADPLHARTLNPDGRHDSQRPLQGLDLRPVTAAYVHLPFCKRKCFYCDFPVVAVGAAGADSPAAAGRFSDYLSLLLREIAAARHVGPRTAGLQTVFFGGGTPSLIPPALLGDVLDALRREFGIAEGAEISMEADPGVRPLRAKTVQMACQPS